MKSHHILRPLAYKPRRKMVHLRREPTLRTSPDSERAAEVWFQIELLSSPLNSTSLGNASSEEPSPTRINLTLIPSRRILPRLDTSQWIEHAA